MEMSATDHELLRHYANKGPDAQQSFTALVERHLNLVYSVARRQLGASQLAEDVAQATFVELARRAGRITPEVSLVGWLHVVSRRKALDVVRSEARRRAREQAAVSLAEMKPTSSVPWNSIEPLLDEAVESLPADDRTAILLRFFENKSLREVGAALGASEDAAQKRIGRAVERLRDYLCRRGVTVSATGLGVELSAHAIDMAPAALGVAITASVGSLAGSAGLAGIFAMSTLQKSVATTAVVLAIGGTVFQARHVSGQREEIIRLRTSTDQIARDAARLREENATPTRAAATPVSELPSAVDPVLAEEATVWLNRLKRLKSVAAERPEWTIPEMALLAESVWLEQARRRPYYSDPDFTTIESLMGLRGFAKAQFATQLMEAALGYLKAHDNQLPASARELAPFFKVPGVTPEMLDRYAVRYSGSYSDVPPDQRAATFVEITTPDEERDQRVVAGPAGGSLPHFRDLRDDVRHALRNFAAKQAGAKPASPAELLPYFNPPLSSARQIKFIETAGALLPQP